MHGIVLQNQGVIKVSVIIENKKAVQYYHVSSFLFSLQLLDDLLLVTSNIVTEPKQTKC